MQEQLLQQLRDIHTPEAVSWWPLAPGWWILLIMILASIVGLCVWMMLKHQREAYRRKALAVADHFYAEFESDQDVATYLGHISQLLRRLILQIGKRDQVADISGQDWIDLLNQYVHKPLTDETATALSEKIYQPNPDANVADVHREVYQWIRMHRKVAHA